ncbi:MAG: class I SAM-dependent methyltransferase [Bacteroidota bacterium]
MKNLAFLFKYFRYLLSSKTLHKIHSPFVYELTEKVIFCDKHFYAFDEIELLRERLLHSEKIIKVKNFGTGKSGEKKISSIVRHSAKSFKYGKLLFLLVNYFHPQTILELGTSLGISTLYLASANKKSKVITIEGCPTLANEARKNFKSLGLNNIESVVGNFDSVLSDVISKLSVAPIEYKSISHCTNCQLIFFDGNHRKTSTLNYFSQCLKIADNNSVFVFDDIHWSNEMEEAWKEIKKHSRVTVTIDLFFLGIVFFRNEQAKQNFVIRY